MAVPKGKLVYTQMCNERGGIEADVTVTRMSDDEFVVVTATANGPHDMDWIKRNRLHDSTAVVDVTSSTAVLALMGPNSRALLGRTSPRTDWSNERFPFGTWQYIDVGYARVRANRVTYVGELGWELHVPSESAEHVYETLMNEAREAQIDLANAGYMAVDTLRVEKGYRA